MDSQDTVDPLIEGNRNLDEILASLEQDMAALKEENTVDVPPTEINDDIFEHNVEVCHSTQVDPNSATETDSPTGNVPSMKAFSGICNFKMNLNPGARSSWVYSSALDQVFIDMHKVLMVQFQVNCIGPGLFIRALPVYCSMDFVNCPVVRCTVHSVEDDPAGQAHSQDGECQCGDYNLAGHVLRVCAFDAQYCYDGRSQRHSVRVPVASPQPGTNCMEVPYIFACKTSCVRGMQRRHINVVFTLETHKNDVIGRQVLSVKICSCPKRDKDRMEKALLESGANPNKQPIQSTSHRPILSPVPDDEEDNPSPKRMKAMKALVKLEEKMGDLLKTCEDIRSWLSDCH